MAGLSQNVLICSYYVIIDIAEKIRECQIFLHGFLAPILYGEIAEVRRTFNGKIDCKSYR